MFLIIILVVLIVPLLFIDFYRKGLRQKEILFLSKMEVDDNDELVYKEKSINRFDEESDVEYESLKDGYILMYFESENDISIKELNAFFSKRAVRMVRGVYQRTIDRNVIFSILADNDEQLFDSPVVGSEKKLIIVMNYKKVSSLGYNVKDYYEEMMSGIDSLNKIFNGVILNENGIRLTKKDRQKYLSVIVS